MTTIEAPPWARTVPALLDAAVYNRVSDDRKGRSKSPQEQNEENLAACHDEGWTVRATYTEPESASASRFTAKVREEWERLSADLKAGKFGVVVVWETSRSARRMAPFVDLLDACRDRGILIHVTSHERTYDPRKWRDRKTLLEDGIAAEGTSEETSQRVSRAARGRAAAGLPNGRLLYGYRREYEYDDHTGKRHFLRQIPREDEAAVVREVFTRYAAGDGLYKICLDLERRGVPVAYRRDPAKRRGVVPQWDVVRLRQMLANPGYKGKRAVDTRNGGKIIGDAVWPALVDEQTWDACQLRLADSARRRGWQPGDVHDKHLLSGVARCGTCGAYLRKVPNHSHRLIYQCRSRGGDPSKGRYCVSIVAEVLETYVTGAALLRLSRPDARELFTADRSTEAAEAAAALLAKTRELEDLHTLVDSGKLTIAALARHEPRLVAEIAALEERARVHLSPVVRDVAGPDAAERWEQLSLAQRKELLNAIMTIRLHKAAGRSRAAEGGGIDDAYIRERIEIGWKTA
jgi:DNA invertase Pin-like site-specific DNA recombinase